MTREEQFIAALKGNISTKDDGFPPVVQAVVVEAGPSFCKVKLTDNDLELQDVMYSATADNKNGFILIPKENTNVLIGTIGGDENSLYIVAMDEVERVKLVMDTTTLVMDKEGTIFNGGGNGGLLISEKVAAAINAIKQDINLLKQAITAWVPVPLDGGTAFKALATPWAGQILEDTVKTTLENDKINH